MPRSLPGKRPQGRYRNRSTPRAGRRLLDQCLECPALLRSYWGGRPTQDSRYSTSYLSSAEWNDTRFKREDFDKLLLQARSELDETKRKELYHTMALMVRDEGGLILPVFNDYVNAASASLKGFVHDIGNDLSNGYVGSRVWFDS